MPWPFRTPDDELLDQLGAPAQVPQVETPAPPPPTPPKNAALGDAMDKMLQSERGATSRDVRRSEVDAQNLTGDKAAEIQKLSKKLGIPEGVVEDNFDLYKDQERNTETRAGSMALDSPRLASWMAQDKYKLASAREDLDSLTGFEKALQEGSRVFGDVKSGLMSFSGSLWGLFEAAGEVSPGAVWTPFGQISGGGLAAFSRGAAEIARGMSEKALGDRSDQGLLAQGLHGGIQSAVMAAPTMALALVGGEALGLAGMGAMTSGSSYSAARKEGVGVGRSLSYAAVQGIIEAATEKIPLDVLLKDVGKRVPFISMIAHQIVPEVTTENIATVLQDMNDWKNLPSNANKTATDFWNERPSAAALTTISTLAMIGMNTSMAHAATRLIGDVNKLAENSKLRERDPAQFADLVDHLAVNSPTSHLFADIEPWQQYWTAKGLDPRAEALKLTGDPAAYDTAVSAGTALQIPVGQYAAQLGASEHAEHFAKELRFSPNMPNVAEAAEAEQQSSELMDSIQQAAEEAALQQEKPTATASPVRAAIVAQTLADPGFQAMVQREGVDGAGVANVYGAMVEAVVSDLAKRGQEDPMDVIARHGLSIGAEGTQAALKAFQEGQQRRQEAQTPTSAKTPAELDSEAVARMNARDVAAGTPPEIGPNGGAPEGETLNQLLAPEQRTSKAQAPPAEEQHPLALGPAQVTDGRLELSTRVPTGKQAQAAPAPLRTDASVVLDRPKVTKAIADKLRVMRQVTKKEAGGSDAQVIEATIQRVMRNLRYLYDKYPPAWRERAKTWYVGAHRIALSFSDSYGISLEQSAGVLAALSPQMDWFKNVSLAERTIQIYQQAEKENPVFTPELMDHYVSRVEAGLVPYARQHILPKHGPEAMAAYISKRKAETRRHRKELTGRSWADLHTLDQARLLRAIDETTNSANYRVILPEGEEGDLARTVDGRPANIGWGTYEFISNAIHILRDGSVETISDRVGGMHKVRSFFNNIINPWNANSVTIDTHAVAAALLEPHAGSDLEVKLTMGGPGDNTTGIKGTNAIYAEAYFRLADELGILPRELQSITWEAVRGLFTPGQKKHGAKLDEAIRTSWQNVRNGGTLTEEALREQIYQFAGGIARPAWADTAPRVALDEGSLRRGDVVAGGAGLPARRGAVGPHPGWPAGRRTGLADGPVVPRPARLASGRTLDAAERTTAATRALGRFSDAGTRVYEGRSARRAGKDGTLADGPHTRTVYEANGDFAGAFADARFGTTPVHELKASAPAAKFFHKLISAAKAKIADGAQVYVYPAEEYRTMRLFVTPEGNAGFAIKSDGDIVSVFNHNASGSARIGNSMVALAVQLGGTKLDCFATTLPFVYAVNGFRVVRRDSWNEEYKPEGWDKAHYAKYNNGEPDVVYMEYDPVALETGPITLFQSAVPNPTTANWTYSRLQKAVELAKAERATGREWKAIIKGSKLGVNQDEFLMTSVSDLSDGKSYAKQEVLDYLRVNQVGIGWHQLGSDKPSRDAITARAEQLFEEEYREKLEHFEDRYPIEVDYPDVVERDGEWWFDGNTFDTEEEANAEAEKLYQQRIGWAEDERATDVRRSIHMSTMEEKAEQELIDEIEESGNTVKYAEYQLDRGRHAVPDSYREVFLTAETERKAGFSGLTPEENEQFTLKRSLLRDVKSFLAYEMDKLASMGLPAEGQVAAQRSVALRAINTYVERWEALLSRTSDPKAIEDMQYALGVLEKLKASGDIVWRDTSWKDGHDQYEAVDNPIVRLRYNQRAAQRVVQEKRELNQGIMDRGVLAASKLAAFRDMAKRDSWTADMAARVAEEEVHEQAAVKELRDSQEQLGATGQRMLFIEEIQPPAEGEDHFDKMPPLFQKNWRELGLKWALRQAAEQGLDGVAWTSGAVQQARYSLDQHVESIEWSEAPATAKVRLGLTASDPLRVVGITPARSDKTVIEVFVDKDGRVIEAELWSQLEGHKLAHVIGEDLAKQIDAASSGTLDQAGMVVGNQGLKKLYDVDLVNVANKLPAMKAAGVKVGTTRIQINAPSGDQHFIEMTPELRASVLGGQTLFQDEQETKRGAITLTPGAIRIQFLTKADLSTFLHETGHLYLHIMDDIVSKVRKGDPLTWSASQKGLIDDFDTVMRWLGATPGIPLTVAQHEQFADGFENYLMAGKAPTPALNTSFARYRSWLTRVYRELKQMAVPLTPEVTGVFDRLVAGENAVAAAQAEARMTPVFSTPEQAGMGPIEWQSYQKIIQAAHEQAQTAMAQRVAGELQRERKAWWKAKRDAMAITVREEIQKAPVYRALGYLQKGLMPDGTAVEDPQRLSKDAIVEKFGKDRLKTLPLPYVYQVDGGLDPDVAAELLGYSSGDALLSALAGAEKLDDVVQKETDARIQAEFGDLRNEGALKAAARQAVDENGFEEVLTAELRAIAKQARLVRSQVTAAKAEVVAEEDSARRAMRRALNAAAVPVEVLRAQAEDTIGRQSPQDIKPRLYWLAAQKESTKAAVALAAGKYEDSVAAKTKQRVAVALHRAALAAIQEADTLEKYAARLARKDGQARLGRAGESYQAQVNALLNKYEFATLSNKALEKRKTLAEWVKDRQDEGLPIDLPADVLEAAQQRNFRTVPMAELREVRDALKQIDKLARLKNELLSSKDKRTFDERKKQLIESIEAKNKLREGAVNSQRRAEKRKHLIADWFGSLKKISELAQQLDGYQDGGPMWELVIRPLNEAADRETARRQLEGAKYNEILKRHYPGKQLGEWQQKRAIPAISQSLSKEEILAVALNWGNETSRDRLLSDKKRKWDRVQVEAILAQLDERDWRFVQDTWDYLDSFWPEISDKQFRVTGIRPEKVAAAYVDTMYGRMRGGYYPIKYDQNLAAAPGANEIATDAKAAMQAAYMRATTKRGHTKTRLEHVERPVRIDLGVLFEHVDQVVHDLTHHEALIDINRILSDRAIADTIHDYGGPVMFEQFRAALTDVALGKRPGGNAMDRAAQYMKTGAQVAALGYNLWTAAQQPMGLFNGAARVGPTWIAKGLYKWLRSPLVMEHTVAWIHDVSPFMAARSVTATQEIAELRNKLAEPGGWFDALVRKVSSDKLTQQNVTDSYLWHIGLMQRVADVPTWLGQYEKSRAGGASEPDAVAFADQAVRDSQGSGQINDLSKIQRGPAVAQLFMTFYSYGNTVYNATSRAAGETEFKSPASVAHFIGNMGLLYAMPAVATVALSRLFGMVSGDDDDPLARWVKDVASEMGASALNTMVFVRELSGMLRSSNRGYQGSAGTRVLQQLYSTEQQIAQGKFDEGLWKELNKTAGILFRYPATQAQRSVEGFIALQQGKTDNPLALLFGPERQQK